MALILRGLKMDPSLEKFPGGYEAHEFSAKNAAEAPRAGVRNKLGRSACLCAYSRRPEACDVRSQSGTSMRIRTRRHGSITCASEYIAESQSDAYLEHSGV